jgi:hypothetical protein
MGEGLPKAAAEIRTMAGMSSNVHFSKTSGMIVKQTLLIFALVGAVVGLGV